MAGTVGEMNSVSILVRLPKVYIMDVPILGAITEISPPILNVLEFKAADFKILRTVINQPRTAPAIFVANPVAWTRPSRNISIVRHISAAEFRVTRANQADIFRYFQVEAQAKRIIRIDNNTGSAKQIVVHAVLQFNLNIVENDPDIAAVNNRFGDDELLFNIVR